MKYLGYIMAIVFTVSMHTNSFAWIKVTKDSKGLFGYKYVNEDHSGGSHMLACANPGWNRCRWDTQPTFEDEGDVPSLVDYEAIELKVNEGIVGGSSAGNFLYNNVYVEYDYRKDSDILTMTLYSFEEAKDLGLI